MPLWRSSPAGKLHAGTAANCRSLSGAHRHTAPALHPVDLGRVRPEALCVCCAGTFDQQLRSLPTADGPRTVAVVDLTYTSLTLHADAPHHRPYTVRPTVATLLALAGQRCDYVWEQDRTVAVVAVTDTAGAWSASSPERGAAWQLDPHDTDPSTLDLANELIGSHPSPGAALTTAARLRR